MRTLSGLPWRAEQPGPKPVSIRVSILVIVASSIALWGAGCSVLYFVAMLP